MHLELDYAVQPRARYGWGAAPHPGLEAMIAPGIDRYRAVLQGFLAHGDALATIAAVAPTPEEPSWVNDFIPGLDGVALYSFVADLRPVDLPRGRLGQLDEVRQASRA